MKKKILLIGSNSSLANQLSKMIDDKHSLLKLSRKDVDVVKNFEKLKKIIYTFRPNILINCIGLTKFIDCEENPEEAYLVNALYPINLANFIRNKKITLIHFSTEAVFQDGLKKMPTEKVLPNPSTIYGNSKLLADKAISKINNSLIIRLPMLVGPTQNHQIINKILKKLRNGQKVFVSNDVYSTPISTVDFSKFFLREIIQKRSFNKKKIIHICSKKRMSTYEVIKDIVKDKKILSNITPVSEDFFKSKFQRPKKLGLKSIYKNCNRTFIYE